MTTFTQNKKPATLSTKATRYWLLWTHTLAAAAGQGPRCARHHQYQTAAEGYPLVNSPAETPQHERMGTLLCSAEKVLLEKVLNKCLLEALAQV